jgi:hypothetical protein
MLHGQGTKFGLIVSLGYTCFEGRHAVEFGSLLFREFAKKYKQTKQGWGKFRHYKIKCICEV